MDSGMEIQWCDHIAPDDVQRVGGYGLIQTSQKTDVLVGKGRVRILCKDCTPRILALIFNAKISAETA